MLIVQNGIVLFDTGCIGTNGELTRSINYNGLSSVISVTVTPNCEIPDAGPGTEWYFEVKCNIIDTVCDTGGNHCLCSQAGRTWALSTSKSPKSDGCGSDAGFPWHIPSYIINQKPWGPAFQNCCNAHDECYSTCGSYRSTCDSNFGSCLQSVCGLYFADVVQCSKYASIYHGAVVKGGGMPFSVAQKDFCMCIA